VLALEIQDLDRHNRRSKVTRKGSAIDIIVWQTGTARLLPRLLARRMRGPVFLTDRRARVALAAADLDPATGRARLSYRRAEEVFTDLTKPLAHPNITDPEQLVDAPGWTLHDLRHTALISWNVRGVLASIYAFTGQPERGIGLAREARQEAADRGLEVLVGFSLTAESSAWTRAGDYAAARQPAMEAVEIARRVRNPALAADAFVAVAQAIWPREPQAALLHIEDSLALTRAGANDPLLGNTLMVAAMIRARNGDLPGALAALQEATLQHHADGTRPLLGDTLRIAVVLAQLGEAEPAAVLSGAFSAHFPTSLSARNESERRAIDRSQALARHALGEAAYDAAVGRGAAMDDDEVVRYAVGEFRRIAALLPQPGVRAPHIPPGPASGQGMTVVPPHPA
jgi:hypothetical protein